MSKVLKYRPDLDGIRALAVLSVIVFHIDPQWLPGGFLGVPFVLRILAYPMNNNMLYYEKLCQSLGISGWQRFHLIE